MTRLTDLIAAVYTADHAYNHRDEIGDEETLWRTRQDARRALNDAVIEELGVNARQLVRLTQT